MTGITQQQAEELKATNRRLLAEITDLKIEVARLKRKLEVSQAFGKDGPKP